MTTRWFTADTHFGHLNIIRYCKRPYDDVARMNADMVQRINARVGADDELWIVGDLAMGQLETSLPVVRGINARIVLVLGNHDRAHPMHGRDRAAEWEARYHDLAGVADFHVHTTLEIAGTSVLVNHLPYVTDTLHPTPDEFADWRPADEGAWEITGHIHTLWRQRGRMINVGLDAWGGYPVAEEQLAELILQPPQDLPIIPWVKD